ncbi:hypothetical protein [Serratia rubidaea]|nr:hypothetical protein [Serratia rubidaea]
MRAAEQRAEHLDAMLSKSVKALKSAERRIAELGEVTFPANIESTAA